MRDLSEEMRKESVRHGTDIQMAQEASHTFGGNGSKVAKFSVGQKSPNGEFVLEIDNGAEVILNVDEEF